MSPEGTRMNGGRSEPRALDGRYRCEWPVATAMVMASPGLATLIDLDGMIRASNPSHARMILGTSAEDARGRHVRDFFDPDMCACGAARARRVLEQGAVVREISMLRGVHMTTTLMPLEVEGEGPMLLVQSTPCDVVRHAALRRGGREIEGEVETEEYPVADLGPLAKLSRAELQVARALASGLEIQAIARALGARPSELSRWIDRIAWIMGWKGERGLRTHAYAMGLHLYDEGYFQTVVLEAARRE